MQTKKANIIRWILLFGGIIFTMSCRYMPDMAEWYARTIYPPLSSALSALSSLFPFPLMEVFVVSLILWLIIYPIHLRKKGIRLRKIMLSEGEILAWVYVWFYLGWGMNYYRHNIYTRLQTSPVAYEEQHFNNFLKDYTEKLNTTYQPSTQIEKEGLKQYVHAFYANLPISYGLAQPKSWQEPKGFIFTPLYSKVGVLGSMGPFFAEAQLNADLPAIQYPFTYAHEFSHLLGVSNEAEANYWAYRACTESSSLSLQYCGYFGLLPYVISNASYLLSKEEFKAWIKSIRPEVIAQYNEKNNYWKERYSPLIGNIQDFTYNLFLKGNKIASGKKNYAEVISLLLSLQEKPTKQ
ncbi:MAG: DUF3810 domain-containing protein [Bacteroides sp.]|nr:DUF3810 domain-containing protein [Bacteroides sp.]